MHGRWPAGEVDHGRGTIGGHLRQVDRLLRWRHGIPTPGPCEKVRSYRPDRPIGNGGHVARRLGRPAQVLPPTGISCGDIPKAALHLHLDDILDLRQFLDVQRRAQCPGWITKTNRIAHYWHARRHLMDGGHQMANRIGCHLALPGVIGPPGRVLPIHPFRESTPGIGRIPLLAGGAMTDGRSKAIAATAELDAI